MEQQGDMTQLLPDDALAGVLARLAPRGIAASRCVCKAWRDIIDAHRILRPDLLPLSLAGIFIEFRELRYSEFFCRPPPRQGLGVRDRIACSVVDHCNGLLLLYDSVANPVMGWEMPLPPRPPPSLEMECLLEDDYLVFDPTTSPHYQVFLIPRLNSIELETTQIKPTMLESEWPPSSYLMWVFSSVHGQWEEKTFIRQGPPAGTIAELSPIYLCDARRAVYWRGALYVHGEQYFVTRLSLLDSTYQVIKPPNILQSAGSQDCYLGKSKKGVYYVLMHRNSSRLQVWVLEESRDGYAEWMLEHDIDLPVPLPRLNYRRQAYGPWILQDVNYNEDKRITIYNDNESTIVDHDSEWNSDDDALDTEDMVGAGNHNGASLLGLHPFKEIVFLSSGMRRGLAYHLSTSKLEDIGSIYPKYYNEISGAFGDIQDFFPYTPCRMEYLPSKTLF
ncbi:hypothetical protein ACQ4PT_022258 [Festuca glaucescens]